MSRVLALVGLFITLCYFAVLFFLLHSKIDRILLLEPNALGDMLAGVFGPLAFVWLVLGYFQQQIELGQNTRALEGQERELGLLVEQNRQLVKSSQEQVQAARDAINNGSKHADEQIRLQTSVLSGQLLLPIFMQTREKQCGDALGIVSQNWRAAVLKLFNTSAESFVSKLKSQRQAGVVDDKLNQQLALLSRSLSDSFAEQRSKEKSGTWSNPEERVAFNSLNQSRRVISLVAQQVYQLKVGRLIEDDELLRVAAFPDFVATYKYCVLPLDTAIHRERSSVEYAPGAAFIHIYSSAELLDAFY